MSLTFYKIPSPMPVGEYLASTLNSLLAHGAKVLWLVPGGSSIKAATMASQKLGRATANLTIGLTDERFGPVGHSQSNWQQLIEAGFDFNQSKALPVLSGQSLETTAGRYSDLLEEALEAADYKLGFFGIGADGHIAGIKPASPALHSDRFYEGYQWDDFRRLTMTPKAFARLDQAVVYAIGQEKRPVLDSLEKETSLSTQPAQLLKSVPKVIIFNDYKGEQR